MFADMDAVSEGVRKRNRFPLPTMHRASVSLTALSWELAFAIASYSNQRGSEGRVVYLGNNDVHYVWLATCEDCFGIKVS